jgi:hypothetical protein
MLNHLISALCYHRFSSFYKPTTKFHHFCHPETHTTTTIDISTTLAYLPVPLPYPFSKTTRSLAKMSTDRTISIVAPAGGRKNFIALDVPVRKLANYSQYAKHMYFPGKDTKSPFGEGDKRKSSNPNEFSLGANMNEDFARTVATFIKNSDATNPAPLTLALFGTERSLTELVKIWRVIGQGFKCPRELHDESIRDDLRVKMYDINPFVFAHFTLIVENVAFDRGLVHSAMDRVAFIHIKGYLAVKDKNAVEEYCKSHEGHWDSLLETVGRVEVKIKEAAAEKAAREASREVAREKTKEGRERKANQIKAGEGTKGSAGKNGGGNGGSKAGNGKGKGKQAVKRFQRKDEDFPPLS